MDFKELWAHVSTFDDPVKAELTNSLKYAAAALPVAIIGSETIRRSMNDDDAQFLEDSFANITNILIRLVAVIVVLFVANRFATYFVPDGDYRVVAHMVVFLVAANSTIGTELRTLVRNYMDVETKVATATQQQVQTMTGPTQFLPPPAIREPTTSTGADIRAPPSVGPGMQPNFNDMY